MDRRLAPVVLLIAACSGPDEPTLAEAQDAAARVLCTQLAQCAPFFVRELLGTGGVDACVAFERASLGPSLAGAGIAAAAGTVEHWQACADYLSASCDHTLRAFTLLDPGPCAVAGTLEDGAGCAYLGQCASLSCRHSAAAACGVCTARAEAGASCAEADCGLGLVCAAGQCVKPGELGDPCAEGAPCLDWLACLDGTCSAPRALDAACTDLVGECDLYQGDVCLPDTQRCTAVRWTDPGRACGLVEGAAVTCTGAECLPLPIAGTCTAFAHPGEACDPASGPHCVLHAECVNGTCAYWDPAACP